MKCFICDSALPEVQFNSDHQDIDPCMTCQIVIQDTLDGFKDGASAPDDAFGEGDPVSAYTWLHDAPWLPSDDLTNN